MKQSTPDTKLSRTIKIIGAAFAAVGLLWLGYLLVRSPVTTTAVEFRATTESPPSPDSSGPTPEPTASAGEVAARAPEPAGVSLWAPSEISKLEQGLLIATDLGSGSSEFSGVTVNEDRNRLLIVDDEDLLFEFDLALDGTPIAPPRRTIEVAAGAGDIEGIAWIAGTTYVLAHETDGQLTVVTIGEDATAITNADVVRTVDTGVRGDDGNGIEGVAHLDADDRGTSNLEFMVVEERPPTLHLIDVDGTVVASIAVELTDASAVWARSPNRVAVVSDEDQMVVELHIDDAGAVTVLDRLALRLQSGRFEQPEGIAWARDTGRLYVVGEAPGPGRYSLGLWEPSS